MGFAIELLVKAHLIVLLQEPHVGRPWEVNQGELLVLVDFNPACVLPQEFETQGGDLLLAVFWVLAIFI